MPQRWRRPGVRGQGKACGSGWASLPPPTAFISGVAAAKIAPMGAGASRIGLHFTAGPPRRHGCGTHPLPPRSRAHSLLRIFLEVDMKSWKDVRLSLVLALFLIPSLFAALPLAAAPAFDPTLPAGVRARSLGPGVVSARVAAVDAALSNPTI